MDLGPLDGILWEFRRWLTLEAQIPTKDILGSWVGRNMELHGMLLQFKDNSLIIPNHDVMPFGNHLSWGAGGCWI